MDISELLYPDDKLFIPGDGDLIIAEPIMNDPYFNRSVALILDTPNDGGHFGLLLNRSTEMTLQDLIPEWEGGRRVNVFCGGPVDLKRMFLLHTLGDLFGDAQEILPGLYVGADIDKIMEYIEDGGTTEGKMRFFLGYCGWSPGQLEAELKKHTWAVKPAGNAANLLKGEGISYWQKEVRGLGEKYRSWLTVPPDPSYN